MIDKKAFLNTLKYIDSTKLNVTNDLTHFPHENLK
jgi:hypothetical protein